MLEMIKKIIKKIRISVIMQIYVGIN